MKFSHSVIVAAVTTVICISSVSSLSLISNPITNAVTSAIGSVQSSVNNVAKSVAGATGASATVSGSVSTPPIVPVAAVNNINGGVQAVLESVKPTNIIQNLSTPFSGVINATTQDLNLLMSVGVQGLEQIKSILLTLPSILPQLRAPQEFQRFLAELIAYLKLQGQNAVAVGQQAVATAAQAIPAIQQKASELAGAAASALKPNASVAVKANASG